MNRRELLGAVALLVSAQGVRAHTPYGQWVVYRKKHLLIGSHRADPETYALANKLIDVLATHLPGAKSRAARAPTAQRLASLIGTDQLDVAVLRRSDAIAMLNGSGKFAPYGRVAIRQMARLGPHILVAHKRFQARHAWLVARALNAGSIVNKAEQKADSEIEWHPGNLSYLQGKPEPALK